MTWPSASPAAFRAVRGGRRRPRPSKRPSPPSSAAWSPATSRSRRSSCSSARPGAGKTTTIAKIAARERAQNGRKLSLLAADGFRVGAVEQLRLYADLIGSPFAVARTPAEIERSLIATASPVLVDTAGRSIGDARALEVAERLSSLPGVRTHVVLPAGSSVRQAARLLDAYGARARRVVLTRLDEGDSVAPLLKLIAERDLTLSYLGTGQRVPDDLERASGAVLAGHILGPEGPEGLAA